MSLEAIVATLAVLLLSVSFHEAAHAWTADRLGDPTGRLLGRISLNPLVHIDWMWSVVLPLIFLLSGMPMLGGAKPVPVNLHNFRHPRRDFATVAVAGPISNLLLAMGAAVIFKVMIVLGSGPSFALSVVARTVTMNVLLAVFNLLPIPPLDGGNVLWGLVPDGVARVLDRVRPYGIVVLYGLIYSGLLGSVVFPLQYQISRWLL